MRHPCTRSVQILENPLNVRSSHTTMIMFDNTAFEWWFDKSAGACPQHGRQGAQTG